MTSQVSPTISLTAPEKAESTNALTWGLARMSLRPDLESCSQSWGQ